MIKSQYTNKGQAVIEELNQIKSITKYVDEQRAKVEQERRARREALRTMLGGNL